MSTFDGNVVEFPEIQIDDFHRHPSRPAVAFFLSHVHSDHLRGLESFKGSFIYCSLATKEILLRLEKYPHRMNFARGILESRVQSYAHLNSVLKPIPLETPTVIELFPGRCIRVTLFDANHCIGSVMFLIEGDGKAILYTGDIRSEKWWVDSLSRNPILLPFVHGEVRNPLRRLDNVYLDTTYATKAEKFHHFPSKASGISELLTKVSEYPEGARFYLDSWTFGYEEVWQALSNFLNSQIHVDDYRYKLYLSLADTANAHGRPLQAFQLIGSACGNHYQEGCLTTKYSRLHSCEQGTGCNIWNQEFVRITPIVSRHDGMNLPELGAGGGQGGLKPHHVLEVGDTTAMHQLKALYSTYQGGDPDLFNKATNILSAITRSQTRDIEIGDPNLTCESFDPDKIGPADTDSIPIARIMPALTKHLPEPDVATNPDLLESSNEVLPQHIVFPYSRHSSYHELCLLIETFRPKDICPCTVDTENWNWSHSMSNLFGHLYDRYHTFRHDEIMQRRSKRCHSTASEGRPLSPIGKRSNLTAGPSYQASDPYNERDASHHQSHESGASSVNRKRQSSPLAGHVRPRDGSGDRPLRRARVSFQNPESSPALRPISIEATANPIPLEKARERMAARQYAYKSALGDGSSWFDITLTSVYGHEKEEEL